jgi:betaine reductase
MSFPAITAVANVLAHAPGLVRYGSKPLRDIGQDPAALEAITPRLRSYADAVAYAPNQAFIGNLDPETLGAVPRPWFQALDGTASSTGAFGDFIGERELLGLLKLCDRARLVHLDAATLAEARVGLERRGIVTPDEMAALAAAGAIDAIGKSGETIPLWLDGRVVGAMARGHEQDEALTANVLLENLAAKATGVLALRRLLRMVEGRLGPGDIDFVLAGSEEAVGDRYQRGGGSLAKAIAESCGITAATGFDVKAFCASTLYAVVNAAALIQAGLFSRVVVVAGGSLAKLGMKYRAHVARQMPILEDVLAGIAILVERPGARGSDPVIRLDTLGLHTIATGSAQQAIVEALVIRPLAKAGYRLRDIDRYATEMHNPEVTEPSGSGDVPRVNYRLIAALGALRGEIPRDGIDAFIATHGMPGFAPTQGHIASAVCYLAHALRAMRAGQMRRALFMAKGSLFLGRMTDASDGVSFILEI